MPQSSGREGALPLAEVAATLVVLALVGFSGALLFAIAEGGYATFQQLGAQVLLPSLAIIALIAAVAGPARWHWLRRAMWTGFWMGAVSTLGLEAVRVVGFRAFHTMPGDLPTLMGVLLTGRIMQGPDTLSTLLGYADHFWNGAAFGILYVLLFGRQSPWLGVLYGLALGTGFLASPVPNAMGAGYFGSQMGVSFAITVYLAHMAYGGLLGLLVHRSRPIQRSIFGYFFAHRPPALTR